MDRKSNMHMKLICFILGFGMCLRADPINSYISPTNMDDWSAADWSRAIGIYCYTNSPVDKTNDAGRPVFSWLHEQPDVTFFVHETKVCPSKYTNLISNTNLFSSNERGLLQKLFDKYVQLKTNASESVRTKVGDGYDLRYRPGGTCTNYNLNIVKHRELPMVGPVAEQDLNEAVNYKFLMSVQEVKNKQLNGLRVEIHDGHPVSLLHFKDDKAVGDWFDWDTNGNLRLHAKFNKPYALFENYMIYW